MTYREIIIAFQNAGIESAEYEAECLIEDLCHVNRLSLFANPEKDYPSEILQNAVKRRLQHEPLQYILGKWQFYRQTYKVSPDCLIPRSDTEILVEEAIERLPKNAHFADLCTGSGCIAISTLAERPDTSAQAYDLSDSALQIAKENSVLNGVSDRLTIEKADLLTVAPERLGKFDALLSNPPYIRTDVIETLSDEVRHEPKMALDGGKDGLVFYRALLKLSNECLNEKGFCLFEIGFDQAEKITQLSHENGYACKIKKDYAGQDRVVILTKQ